MPNEILDLSTIVEHVTVRISSKKFPGGKLYELANVDDLGPIQHQRLAVAHQDAMVLLGSAKELTPPQERALDKALGDVVKILLPKIEPAVLKETTMAHRVRILQAWIGRNESEAAPNPSTRRTGAASSRASKRSSAATRKRGSTARRGS